MPIRYIPEICSAAIKLLSALPALLVMGFTHDCLGIHFFVIFLKWICYESSYSFLDFSGL
jgi:hypothetical protein